MSVIVGFISNEVAYIGADTLASGNEYCYNCTDERFTKIVKLDNGIILGGTGSVKSWQVLLANSDIFSLDKKGELTKKHIVKNIVPKIHYLLQEKELFENDEDKPIKSPNTLLLAHDGKIFTVNRYLCVTSHSKYVSLGTGDDYVVYSLLNIDESKNIERQLVEAMKVCPKFLTSVGGPYILINTKDLKFVISEK